MNRPPARRPHLQGLASRRPYSRYMDRQDRPSLIESRFLAVATLVTGGAYIGWLWFRVNPYHPWMDAAFVVAELACLALFVLATFTVWTLRYKPPDGLPITAPQSVDVFVTVCGEPLPVVAATLAAAAAIQWSARVVRYVLDDGGSDDVRVLAERAGFQYRSRLTARAPLHSAKAGNLNFGLSQSDGDLILVLDADQVASASILRVLAGYMRFPDVAFIQSRQFYHVPLGDPFFNLDRVFYQAVQLGYDNRSNALSCGSGVIYRRSALEQNGGFSSWNVVEDLTTSYDLHGLGWRSFYYPHAVTTGLAPADIWGVYRQRSQWALDALRLFVWDNPLLKRGLRRDARLNYLVVPLAYLSAAFVYPFFFMVPLWTYLTGASVISGNEIEFVVMRGAYFATMACALRVLFRRHQAGRQFQMLAGLFPVYITATIRALLHPKSRVTRYRPNNSVNGRRQWPALVAVVPQLALVAANAILPFYAIFANTAPPRLILSTAVISAGAIWALLPTIVAALGSNVWDQPVHIQPFYGHRAETDA